jgi:hypothetical protein
MWDVVELVGEATLALVGAALLSVLVATGTAAWAHRGHGVPLKAFSVFVLDFFYVPLKRAFGALGQVAALDEMMVALKNRANRRRFARTRRRLLLAPQCLRHIDCPAPSTGRGILCEACGRCKLDGIVEEAKRLGYGAYIVAGSSFIARLIEQEKPDGALLIACPYECNKVMMALGRLATYAVYLDKDGCVSTDIAVPRVLDAMRLGLNEKDGTTSAIRDS